MGLEPRQGVRELEKEQFRMLLHIRRHAEKDGPDDVTPEADRAMPLTVAGRGRSLELGKIAETDSAIAVGGSLRRLRETALFASAGSDSRVDQETQLEQLRQLLDKKSVAYEKREWKIEGLEMAVAKDDPFFTNTLNPALKRRDYFKTIVAEHDKDHDAENPSKNSMYMRQAYGFAKILDFCVKASPKLRESYLHHGDPLTREAFIVAQSGVTESFLAEVIDRTRGRRERDAFVAAVHNGFSYGQGFDLEVRSKGEGRTSLMLTLTVGAGDTLYSYRSEIPLETLAEILEDFRPSDSV